VTQIALPVGYWTLPDPRAAGRSLVNCFAEVSPLSSSQLSSLSDDKQRLPPAYLRRAPGATVFATDGSGNAVRGMWEMAGVLYAVIGPSLYTVSSGGGLVQIATGITGSGFVRMTDNTACLVILVPNSTFCYTYCPNGGGFAPLTAAGFTGFGAIDCWFCDTYICFLAQNGRTMFSDDGQTASGQNQITFNTASVFPRELGTDLFVGMAVDHRQVVMFGQVTTEAVGNVGNAVGSPFASTANTYMPIGMHPSGAYTTVIQDQTVFWLANDLTVRRRNGQTPLRVSNHSVEYLLSQANLTGCYAFAYSMGGHLMYVLTAPASGLTLVYDVTTQEWHKMESLVGGTWTNWRPLCAGIFFGQQLVGDSQGAGIGALSFTTYTEYGQPMMAKMRTQSVYSEHNRISHRRLELVITPGESLSLSQGAFVTCRVSDDGMNWRSLPMRSLGASGQYNYRAVWFNLGLSRDRQYEFRISDPTPLFTIDIVAELKGGRW
jgi:hypothetical protein